MKTLALLASVIVFIGVAGCTPSDEPPPSTAPVPSTAQQSAPAPSNPDVPAPTNMPQASGKDGELEINPNGVLATPGSKLGGK